MIIASLLIALLPVEGPFADLDYADAQARAVEQQKLLFVDFTASWCQPCKKMERDTWSNAEVVAWLRDHAVTIQVDVDEQKELARQFEVGAMPTVVVVRGDSEFDRVIGYKDAGEFLAWARDVAAGKRSSDELMQRARELADSEDVDARYDLASDLLQAGQHDLALEHYLWLWPATREVPGMYGVRLSFMLGDMAELAEAHPPARTAFEKILEGLQAEVDCEGIPDQLAWGEWSSMCKSFGQEPRIERWYERHRDAEGRLFAGELAAGQDALVAQQIRAEVFKVLLVRDRREDAVRVIGDASKYALEAIERYERIVGTTAEMDEPSRDEIVEFSRRAMAAEVSAVYAALLAVGQSEDAAAVARLLIDRLDTPGVRLALVGAALSVAPSEPSLERWLDEAEASGEAARTRSLRRRLERARKAEQVDR